MLPPSAGAVPLRTPYANGTVDGHRCSRRQLNAARTTTETWNITIATSIASECPISTVTQIYRVCREPNHTLASRAGLDVFRNPWIGHNAKNPWSRFSCSPAPRNGTYFFARIRARAVGKFLDSGARDCCVGGGNGTMARGMAAAPKQLPRVATRRAMCFLSRRVGPRGPWEGCVGNSFAASH
jgi:hypothetical protein